MSAQQEAKEFFSEDESDSFNTNRMYTEGIEDTAQDYYDALDANGMYDLYQSSVFTNLRARQQPQYGAVSNIDPITYMKLQNLM